MIAPQPELMTSVKTLLPNKDVAGRCEGLDTIQPTTGNHWRVLGRGMT